EWEPVLRQSDRRCEQALPAKFAELPVRGLEHPQYTGHANRSPTDDGIHEPHRAALRVDEQVFSDRRGRGLAAIEGAYARPVPVHEQRTATDAGALWLDERQDHLHGDRRIDRASARAQDFQASL